jgi:hypothetical protein
MALSTIDTSSISGLGYGFKNRIINGGMVIDQRNAGASVTPANGAFTYTVDRWAAYVSQASKLTVQQNAGSVTPPVGFTNYLGVTSSSAYSVVAGDIFCLQQQIEGYNVADFNWGTANAQPATLSFWVRSSLTGTFGACLRNNGAVRSYPFTYTVSSANTWTQISVTIAGDTSGTWLTTTGIGFSLSFGLGVGSTYSGTAGSWSSGNYASATGATSVVGTSGATFYITGVQLEKGTVATSFDWRPYGTELALCQRYYYKVIGVSANSSLGVGYAALTTIGVITTSFPVTMRTNPTALEQSGTAGHYAVGYLTTSASCTAVPTFNSANPNTAASVFTTSGLTAGHGVRGINDNAAGYLAWSAEL